MSSPTDGPVSRRCRRAGCPTGSPSAWTRGSGDGTAAPTLLGGSPLRLLRLAPAGARPAGRRPARRRRRDDGGARRAPAGRRAGPPDLPPAAATGDVTVVIPVKDRPAGLARLLAALRADPATARPAGRRGGRRLGGAGRGAAGRVVVRHDVGAGPGGGAQRRAAGGADAGRRLPGLRLRAPGRLAAAPAAAPGRSAAGPRRPADRARCRATRGWLAPLRGRGQRAGHGLAPRRRSRPRSRSPTCRARRCCVRRAALGERLRRDDAGGRGRRPGLAAGRGRLAGAVRAGRGGRARAPGHDGGVAAPPGVLRHGRRAAGRAARQRGRPARRSRRSRRRPGRWRWPAAGRAGRRRPACSAVADGAAGPAARAARGAARRSAFAAALVLRGTGASGRALARAVTRHHWPLAVVAARWSPAAPGAGCSPSPRSTRSPPGGRTANGWDRSVSPRPGGWRTSPTAPGSGGAPSGHGTRGRFFRRVRNEPVPEALVAVGTADCANDGPASSTTSGGPRDNHPGTAGRGRRTAHQGPGPAGDGASRARARRASWPSAR